MELGAPGVHHAVDRPDPTVLGEVRGRLRVPVGRVHDGGAGLLRLADRLVDDRHDVLATLDIEPAIGVGEVVLGVDHHERGQWVVRGIGHRFGDSSRRPRRPFSLLGSSGAAWSATAASSPPAGARRRRGSVSSGAAEGRRRERLRQDRGEPLACGLPVAELRAVLGRGHGEHAVDEPRREPAEHPRSLHRPERRGRREVETELDARVGRVHRLTARSRGAAEPPSQLALGDDDRAGHAQRAGHQDPFHTLRA